MPRKITFNDFKPLADDCIIIILVEHLGDIIACEPVIRYARKKWPGKDLAWVLYDKYSEIFAGHPDLDFIVETPSLFDITDFVKSVPDSSSVINLHFSGRVCSVTNRLANSNNRLDIDGDTYYDYGSLLEAFSLIAGLPALTDAPKYYFSSNQPEHTELPERYVVFHCRSNEEKRDWTYENWMKLFLFFAAKEIGVVEIGFESVLGLRDSLFYYDMTHIRSIDQIAKIIRGSEFFFGIDSAFAHLSNALHKDGLVILGKYANWERYCPYTGFYCRGHTIGYRRLPARYIEAEKVIARYKKVAREGFDNTPELPVRAAPDQFPNLIQRILLKIYRPVVKNFSSSFDYALFKRESGTFFIIPGRPAPLFGFMRLVLSLLGPVPPKLNDTDEF